jgi:hypothetical protein
VVLEAEVQHQEAEAEVSGQEKKVVSVATEVQLQEKVDSEVIETQPLQEENQVQHKEKKEHQDVPKVALIDPQDVPLTMPKQEDQEKAKFKKAISRFQ